MFAIKELMPRLASDDSIHIVTTNVDAFVSLCEIFGVYKQCHAKYETDEELNTFLQKIETISKNFLFKYIYVYPLKPSDYVLRLGLFADILFVFFFLFCLVCVLETFLCCLNETFLFCLVCFLETFLCLDEIFLFCFFVGLLVSN